MDREQSNHLNIYGDCFPTPPFLPSFRELRSVSSHEYSTDPFLVINFCSPQRKSWESKAASFEPFLTTCLKRETQNTEKGKMATQGERGRRAISCFQVISNSFTSYMPYSPKFVGQSTILLLFPSHAIFIFLSLYPHFFEAPPRSQKTESESWPLSDYVWCKTLLCFSFL